MKFTKIKNGLIITLLTVLLAATAVFCGIFATKNSQDNSLDANAGASGLVNAGTIATNSGSNITWSVTGLSSMIKYLTGKSNGTYYDLLKSSSVTTTSGIDVADMRANIQTLGGGTTKNLGVTIGGKVFSPTYVSKDRSGNVIVTMWLNVYDSAEGVQQYNSYTNADETYTYPSNMYSSSYLRSYITGSYYATSGSSASSRVSTTQWQTFGSNFSSYIVTPNQVEWQKNENCYGYVSDYYCSNEGWNHTYTAYNNYKSKGSTSNGTNYFAWGADKLWIPSIAETGITNTKNGIWKTNGNLRASGKATWARTSGATRTD